MYKNSQNQKQVKALSANIEIDTAQSTMILSGDWVWATINEEKIANLLQDIATNTSITINATRINDLDTSGIYFINKIIQQIRLNGANLKQLVLPDVYVEMFNLVQNKLELGSQNIETNCGISSVASIGLWINNLTQEFIDFIAFFGSFCQAWFRFLRNPRQLKWNEVSRTISDAGAKGMWVVAMLCFLIGVTLAYEMSPQFRTYGANVYIVNFLGIALLKEVAPLLSAVIVAGRTGASIAAEIGTQKLQEEIDAIKTMGISPMERIVLPKVIGVMIAVPLITAIGDIMSMLGGALVAKPMLGVSYSLFLERMQTYVATSNYASGIIKSLAFAGLIALAGCFCGFRVEGNANSIGEKTTKSVVLGIILVIFCDAVFAIIFNEIGW